MIESNNPAKTFEQVIKSRRSIRDFTNEFPSTDDINRVISSAIYAPYGEATGIPLRDIRKIFVLKQNTETMKEARELLISQIKKNSTKINILLILFPFLKKKMKIFSNRLKMLSKNGISSLNDAPYYIIVAEKKGFPPIEKESIAHAMQNMWLTATSLGLGFQMISATGMTSKNRKFLKLINLSKGNYEINGCAVGYAVKYPENIKEFDLDEFVTWVK